MPICSPNGMRQSGRNNTKNSLDIFSGLIEHQQLVATTRLLSPLGIPAVGASHEPDPRSSRRVETNVALGVRSSPELALVLDQSSTHTFAAEPVNCIVICLFCRDVIGTDESPHGRARRGAGNVAGPRA
jgi:hypothetical protein